MPGSISDFRASFTTDIAKPSKFDVNIPIPLSLIPYISSAKNLTYRCEAAQLPGRTFATVEQQIGSNPVEKYPHLTTFNDIDLTFIVDNDMSQKVFFDAWLNYINPQYNYNFRYKGDYATVITVNQYNSQNQITYSINLYDAYPVSINQLDLDWSADGYHKLVVTFAYTSWQNNSLQALGMELLDMGINTIVSAAGGLGGSAISGLGQGILGGVSSSLANDPNSASSTATNDVINDNIP
jgi:hypothetical protein